MLDRVTESNHVAQSNYTIIRMLYHVTICYMNSSIFSTSHGQGVDPVYVPWTPDPFWPGSQWERGGVADVAVGTEAPGGRSSPLLPQPFKQAGDARRWQEMPGDGSHGYRLVQILCRFFMDW